MITKKIIIAEDDKFLLSAYKAKFVKVGFELKTASDGNEVFTILKDFIPDIILLDLIMPAMDGFAVLEKLAGDPKYQSIPVLVASNLGQKEDIDRAIKLGAKGFITKSDMTLDQIITKIHVLIG